VRHLESRDAYPVEESFQQLRLEIVHVVRWRGSQFGVVLCCAGLGRRVQQGDFMHNDRRVVSSAKRVRPHNAVMVIRRGGGGGGWQVQVALGGARATPAVSSQMKKSRHATTPVCSCR
jgi:hypothetical protein